MKQDLGHDVTKYTDWHDFPVGQFTDGMRLVRPPRSIRGEIVVLASNDMRIDILVHQGWGERWCVVHDISTPIDRYIVTSDFDGPVDSGAGRNIVEAVFTFNAGSVASAVAAYTFACDMVRTHMLAELIDNITP